MKKNKAFRLACLLLVLSAPARAQMVDDKMMPPTLIVPPQQVQENYDPARAAGELLLTPEGYLQHLEAVWEVTQRTIKGQVNE